jgi:acyl carrier protein
MDTQEVRRRVLAVVFDMAPLRDAEVAPASSLREDLGYDSLSLLELAVALEDEFRLPASAELDAEAAETVLEVEDIVRAKLRALVG